MESHIALAVLVGLGTFLALHVTVWRVWPSNAPRIALLAGLALVGMGMSGLTVLWLHGLDPVALCVTVWISTFLIIAYFFIYAGEARSVSVTLLERLRLAGTQPVSLGTLLAEYAASRRFRDRIQVMHDAGLVRLRNGAVRLTPVGRALSRGAMTLSRLLVTELQG